MTFLEEQEKAWDVGVMLDRLDYTKRGRQRAARSKAQKGIKRKSRTGSVLLVCQGFYR